MLPQSVMHPNQFVVRDFAYKLSKVRRFLTIEDYEQLVEYLLQQWPLYRRGRGMSFAIRFDRAMISKYKVETAHQILQDYAASLMVYVEILSSFNGQVVYERPRRWHWDRAQSESFSTVKHSPAVAGAIARGRKTSETRKKLIENWRKGEWFPSCFSRADWRIIELITQML